MSPKLRRLYTKNEEDVINQSGRRDNQMTQKDYGMTTEQLRMTKDDSLDSKNNNKGVIRQIIA
jgi:hypothetical protein